MLQERLILIYFDICASGLRRMTDKIKCEGPVSEMEEFGKTESFSIFKYTLLVHFLYSYTSSWKVVLHYLKIIRITSVFQILGMFNG